MNDINIKATSPESSVLDDMETRARSMMRTVERLMGTTGGIIRKHTPNSHPDRPNGWDILCDECDKQYPCETVQIAENALMAAREMMRDA